MSNINMIQHTRLLQRNALDGEIKEEDFVNPSIWLIPIESTATHVVSTLFDI